MRSKDDLKKLIIAMFREMKVAKDEELPMNKLELKNHLEVSIIEEDDYFVAIEELMEEGVIHAQEDHCSPLLCLLDLESEDSE